MVYTQIPVNTFKELQLNAGVFVSEFAPESGNISRDNIIGATTGGATLSVIPTFKDLGDDIDNCPKNMKELKQIESYEVKASGTFLTVNADMVASLIGGADVSGNKITPRLTLKDSDFADIWWVGDYSDKNTGSTAGFMAIKLINALSTGGFQLTTSDKEKGQFAFEYTGHASMDNPDAVPCEIYVKAGT